MRIVVAIALAAACFAAIVAITSAAGYGRDLHTLRVAATLGVLLPTILVLVWPGRTIGLRVQAFALALVLTPLAWWRVPCRFDGPFLFHAAVKRDAMILWLATLPPDDVKPLPRIRDTVESLAADFPSLCADAREAVDRKIAEVVESRVQELRELSATDPAGFAKTAASRSDLVKAFPEAKPQLVEAERKWAARWARFTAVAYTEAEMSPGHIRVGCRNSEKLVLEFPSLDETPERLLEARRVFFHAAHETAEKEIRGLHEGERFERAFGVALAHGFEWSQVPGLLSPAERKDLDALREQCRALLRSGGDPEAISPPRAIETGPAPRPK